MLDPISSLGLAGNVVQLVTFAASIVSEGNRRYQAADGILLENKETADVVQDLSALSTSLTGSLRTWSSAQHDPRSGGSSRLDDNDAQLEDICSGCRDIAEQLLTQLRKLGGSDGRRSRVGSYRQALVAVWKKDEVEKIEKRLKMYQDQLNTRILHRLVTDAEAWKVANRVQYGTLTQQSQDAISAVLSSRDQVTTLLQLQSQQLQDIATGQEKLVLRHGSSDGQQDDHTTPQDDRSSKTLRGAVQRNSLPLAKRLLRNRQLDSNDADDLGRTPLHMCESFEMASELLKHPLIDPDATDDQGRTPLHYSALKRRLGLMRALLTAGAQKDNRDEKGKTARDYTFDCPVAQIMLDHSPDPNHCVRDGGQDPLLVCMAWLGDEEGIRFLLDSGADINGMSPSPPHRQSALCLLARRGDLPLVKLLCERGADMELPGGDDWPVSPLMTAVRFGRVDVVAYLLSKGARTDVRLASGNNVLAEAWWRDQWECVRLLLQHGEDVGARDCFARTVLITAAQRGQKDIVQLALSLGAQREASTHDGTTALIAAACAAHNGCMRVLLEAHADITARNDQGWTPLTQAVGARSEIESVKLLLAHGASVNARGHVGHTALGEAAYWDQPAIAKLLLEHGGNMAIRTDHNNSILSIAASRGNVAVMRVFLETGVDRDEASHLHRKIEHPLMRAASEGHPEVIQLLAEYGANLDIRDVEGRTALMHAALGDRSSAVAMLIEKGAALDVQDSNYRGGETALMIAAGRDFRECVRLLIAAGANQHLRDQCGWTAWSKAAFAGHDAGFWDVLRPSPDVGEALRTRQEEDGPEDIARYMLDHHGV